MRRADSELCCDCTSDWSCDTDDHGGTSAPIEFDLSKTQEGYNMARERVRMQKHLSAEGRGGIVFFYYTPEQEATVANNYTRMKEEQRQKRANDKAAGKPTHTARRKERVARQ